MSEFDAGNCNESCIYSKNADMQTCRECQKVHNMPHSDCCLEWCGSFEFCKSCKNRMYAKMGRLTKRISGYAHGAEGICKEKLTGKYCRGNFEATACIEKLAEYEDLEEQGKLLKLPCAVGDTIYTNCSMQGWYFRKENRPYMAKVVFIGFNGEDNYINVDFKNGRMLQFKFSDIGKTVFLIREEAEAALKAMSK